MLRGMLLAASVSTGFLCPAGVFSSAMRARQTDPAKPVVVQPGAPGKPSRTLPPSTRATLPPRSQADVEFMQGMIMHHAQAVEMTALIAVHSENKELRLLAARISSSQSDEIKFMQELRKARGAEFDRLFLTGMIQHHGGALTMVKDLFDTAGAGQDAELFNFATDVDSGQRAEIRIMQTMLEKESLEEKR